MRILREYLNGTKSLFTIYLLKIDRYAEKEYYPILTFCKSKCSKPIISYKMNLNIVRSILGELCIRYILMKRYNLYQNVNIKTAEFGKPFFPNIPLHFNYSHTNSYVAAIVSNYPVGVDIEYMGVYKFDEIANHFFSKSEQSQIHKCPFDKKKLLFYQLWTAKESFGKCVGCGLNRNILCTPVIKLSDSLSTCNFSGQTYFVHSQFILHDYALSLSSPVYIENIDIEIIQESDFDDFVNLWVSVP